MRTRLWKELAARPSLVSLGALVLGLTAASGAQAHGSWTIHSQPTTRDLAKLSFVSDMQGWVVGEMGTILMTTDGGVSWVSQASPVALDIVDIDMLDKLNGFALAQELGENPQTTVLHTENGGAEWQIRATLNDRFNAAAYTDEANGVVVGEEGRILRSVDGGRSWIPANIEHPELAAWKIGEVEFLSSTFGLALGGQYDATGVVWKTLDGGASWTHMRVAGEPVWGAWAFDAENIICVGGDLDYGAGMVMTAEAGESWDYTDLHMWGQAQAVAFRDGVEGWAPLGVAGAYMVSVDSGRNWTSIPAPNGAEMFDVTFTSADVGYMVGTAGTVLRYVAGGGNTGVNELPASRSGEMMLFQNSPNPFALKTEVQFRVAAKGVVTLKVYDLAGREVATLVDEKLEPGSYTRTLEAGKLASGSYYYKLSMGDRTATRKMMVVK